MQTTRIPVKVQSNLIRSDRRRTLEQRAARHKMIKNMVALLLALVLMFVLADSVLHAIDVKVCSTAPLTGAEHPGSYQALHCDEVKK